MFTNYDGTSNEVNFPLIGHSLLFTKVHWNMKKCKIIKKKKMKQCLLRNTNQKRNLIFMIIRKKYFRIDK